MTLAMQPPLPGDWGREPVPLFFLNGLPVRKPWIAFWAAPRFLVHPKWETARES